MALLYGQAVRRKSCGSRRPSPWWWAAIEQSSDGLPLPGRAAAIALADGSCAPTCPGGFSRTTSRSRCGRLGRRGVRAPLQRAGRDVLRRHARHKHRRRAPHCSPLSPLPRGALACRAVPSCRCRRSTCRATQRCGWATRGPLAAARRVTAAMAATRLLHPHGDPNTERAPGSRRGRGTARRAAVGTSLALAPAGTTVRGGSALRGRSSATTGTPAGGPTDALGLTGPTQDGTRHRTAPARMHSQQILALPRIFCRELVVAIDGRQPVVALVGATPGDSQPSSALRRREDLHQQRVDGSLIRTACHRSLRQSPSGQVERAPKAG